ncbi:hypothetical protein Tco_0833860 [Tanacetum coccineum]
MLRHRLTVPPTYYRDVAVAGNIIQTVQTGLRQAYECIAYAPISPWLTAKKESGSPLQTASVCTSNPLIATDKEWLVQEGTALGKDFLKSVDGCQLASPEQTATGKDVSNPLYGCDGFPKTVRVFQFTLDSRSEKLDWLIKSTYVAAKTGSCCSLMLLAVHRVHAVSFDAAVASTVFVACWFYDAAHFVFAAPQSSYFEKIYLETWN